MNAKEINDLLMENDSSQSKIADSLGIRASTVNIVVHGHRESRRIQDYICSVVGLKYSEVWSKEDK